MKWNPKTSNIPIQSMLMVKNVNWRANVYPTIPWKSVLSFAIAWWSVHALTTSMDTFAKHIPQSKQFYCNCTFGSFIYQGNCFCRYECCDSQLEREVIFQMMKHPLLPQMWDWCLAQSHWNLIHYLVPHLGFILLMQNNRKQVGSVIICNVRWPAVSYWLLLYFNHLTGHAQFGKLCQKIFARVICT